MPKPVLIDDTLRVGTEAIAGEDPRLTAVRAAASAPDLTKAGVGWLLVEHGTPGRVDPRWLADATEVWSGQWLTLYRTPGEPTVKALPWLAVFVANGLALATILTAVLLRMLPMRTLFRGRISLPRKE